MSEAQHAASVGLFPVSYQIGSNAPGAQRLQLDLLVYTPDRSLRGNAVVSQTTNPPLNLQLDAWGTYAYLTVQPPTDSKILVTLQGNHGGPSANSPGQLRLHLLLDSDWQRGVATYQYYNGQRWIEVEQVPAQLDNQRVKALPNVDTGSELNTATLEAAIASGNLEQLKQLAAGSVGKALDQAIAASNTTPAKAGKAANKA
ncbi:hypothetical protein CCOS865_03491 [Pseudomonas reidholzensis]|uniref:DUF1842 domain-containing protein n=1 Tax=Pseudomonas reidholzensis TaxID=1785162 RepID=A0A383RW23_9PSED|nr:DUF1842 domain-containing protein [Pseudomonas reidholzensis]SYX91222.1 hypothetical protein CCOS865_03491 [Pseudomonas reidholzensis]